MYKHVNQNTGLPQAENEHTPPLQLLKGWSKRPLGSLGNAVAVLRQDPALACLGGKLTVETLGHHVRARDPVSLLSAPPWGSPEAYHWGACDSCDKPIAGPDWPRPIGGWLQLRLYLERTHKLVVSERVLGEALELIGTEREPVHVTLFHMIAAKPKTGTKGTR